MLRLTLFASVLMLGTSLASADEKWGALSIDFPGEGHSMATAYYGVGGGDTQDEAVANAQKFCAENGKHCQSVVSYRACAAYASDEAHGGYGADDTEKAAKDRALRACGQGDCKILVSDCN
jgi:hypothetical protein